MLLCTLGASLLGNNLAGKRMNRAGEEAIAKSVSKETKSKRQVRGIVRASYGNKKVRKTTTKNKWFLMPPLPLTNFEIQKYY